MSTYTDIDLDLTQKRDGDIQEFVGIDAINSSLNNIIGTLKRSRRKLPTFACNLWDLLFEPMDEITAFDIGEELTTAIEKWETRVAIENIRIIPNYEKNRYDIKGKYILRNSRQQTTYDFETFLSRG